MVNGYRAVIPPTLAELSKRTWTVTAWMHGSSQPSTSFLNTWVTVSPQSSSVGTGFLHWGGGVGMAHR